MRKLWIVSALAIVVLSVSAFAADEAASIVEPPQCSIDVAVNESQSVVSAPAPAPRGGRYKQDDPVFCDGAEPNGGGTSQTCKAAYNPVCNKPGYSPGSESCSVKGTCNVAGGGGATGTKCDCSVWCVKDN